jgi:hypothetical protein
VDHWGILDLVERIDIPELRVGIVRTMSMVFLSDFCEMLRLSAVLFHVFTPCISEELGGKRRLRSSSQLNILDDELLHGIRSVIKEGFQRAFEHFLEAEGHDTFSGARLDSIVTKVQRSGSSTTVIVHVYDWNTCSSDLVNGALSRCRVSVDVADVGLLDLFKIDVGVA